MATNNLPSRSAGETGLRHVWLAGLGMVSVMRREAVSANDRAFLQTARLQRRTVGFVNGIKSRVITGTDSARAHLDPMVAKFRDGLDLWVAPTLERLGLRSLAPRTGRKPAAKTKRRVAPGQSRRSTRKA